ncbi:hypothetical protein AALO_G00089180 [Alosa alosa]|uniref:Uncharacterized protein n=1 Tax=Alosa alosa TaxID=278164 RepID=A0AAV6H370_9TELE|nr:hypothetical protein AALO_G00089180 [Alosa alosa]
MGLSTSTFSTRKAMFIVNILAVIGGALMELSTICSFEMVIALFCGIFTGLTPMFFMAIRISLGSPPW